MYRKTLRKISILLLVITMTTMSGTFAYASGSVSLSKYNSPTTLKVGQNYSIKGVIKSKSKIIKRVEVGIVDKNNKWTAYKYDNKKVNSKSFNLANASKKVVFKKLKAGTYRYRIYAHTKDGKVHTLLNKRFTVKANTSSGGINTSGFTYPKTVTQGNGFSLKGKITSTKTIQSVTAGVTNKAGSWTSVKSSMKVNAKAFNMSQIDAKVKFGKLSVGNYKYKVVVTTSGGSKTVVYKDFRVVAKKKTASASVAKAKPTSVNTLKDNAGGKASGKGIVSISGVNKPSNYKIGKKFNPKGTIKSKQKIKRVEIGIVYGPTNKWLGKHKYDKSRVNATSFNISNAASKLSFNTLPAGVYRYRIYVHTEKGVYLMLNHAFKVSGNGKPETAVKWAVKIANDNSFTYGRRPATARVGCYFCGTNQKRKPKGYEKTYVCMTFVHAAYAHGAKDPELLKHCKGGKYCLSLNDNVFKEYTCWEKIGYCKDLKVSDLLPGDVICWYADDDYSGHLSMYAGNGNIVDAGVEGWGANSIAVRKGRAAYYLSHGKSFNKKSFVMRYRK